MKIHTDEKALAIAFQKNPGAIGVFASLHADSLGKPISIALKEGRLLGPLLKTYILATTRCKCHSYCFIQKDELKSYCRYSVYFYSAEVAQAIFRAGLAPVPDNFRNAELKKVTE